MGMQQRSEPQEITPQQARRMMDKIKHRKQRMEVSSSSPAAQGFGIASLVLAIVAALFCWIPWVGMIAFPAAGIGIVLGIIGIISGPRQSGLARAGLIICILAILIQSGVQSALHKAEDARKEYLNKKLRNRSNTSPNNADSGSPTETNTVIKTDALEAYGKFIKLGKIETGKGVLGDQGVFGEIKNTGTRSVSKIKIRIYALDRAGKAIWDTTYHPVLVLENPLWVGKAQEPLKPNYARKFGCKIDPPSDWSGKVRVEIIELELVEER